VTTEKNVFLPESFVEVFRDKVPTSTEKSVVSSRPVEDFSKSHLSGPNPDLAGSGVDSTRYYDETGSNRYFDELVAPQPGQAFPVAPYNPFYAPETFSYTQEAIEDEPENNEIFDYDQQELDKQNEIVDNDFYVDFTENPREISLLGAEQASTEHFEFGRVLTTTLPPPPQPFIQEFEGGPDQPQHPLLPPNQLPLQGDIENIQDPEPLTTESPEEVYAFDNVIPDSREEEIIPRSRENRKLFEDDFSRFPKNILKRGHTLNNNNNINKINREEKSFNSLSSNNINRKRKQKHRKKQESFCGGASDLGFCALTDTDHIAQESTNQLDSDSELFPHLSNKSTATDLKLLIKKCQHVIDLFAGEVSTDVEELGDHRELFSQEAGGPWSWKSYQHKKKQICSSEISFILPAYAKDKQETWYMVVQTRDILQKVAIEMCHDPGSPCPGLSDCGTKSRCVQRYNYQYLLSLHPDLVDCPKIRAFKFPAGCVCHREIL